MKKILITIMALTVLILGFSYADDSSHSNILNTSEAKKSSEDSDGAFDKMMRVLMHQRCVNCHPSGDVPRKGDDSHVTRSLGIPRGDHGHGLKGISCETCHTEENNDFSGVPGAPDWALAPDFMTWEGKTRVEIATQMMDPKRNGGKTPHQIMEHLTEHELVLWAWEPGVDAEGIPREKPPIGKEEYISAVKEWMRNGALIPEK